jgi:Domain of unknown function (DUF4388)
LWVDGDLRDIGTANLVQAVCANKKKTGVLMKRDEVEGYLFFDDGLIVDARVGLLEGEHAAVYLLKWTEGTFRMSAQFRSGARTVGKECQKLLAEAERRLELDRGGSSESEAGGDPADDDLEATVFTLLSRLEQGVTKLKAKRGRSAHALLDGLGDLLDLVAEVHEGMFGDWLRRTTVAKAFEAARVRFPDAPGLTIDEWRFSVKAAVKTYEDGDAKEEGGARPSTRLVAVLRWMLEEYLAMFGRLFRSSSRERQWWETCAVFLRELDRVRDEF